MPYDVVAFEADEAARELSIAEEGLFHRMLRLAWMNGSVPCDIPTLAKLCRVRPSTLQKAWPRLSKLWANDVQDPSRLRNKKQEKERIFLESKRNSARESAKLSWKSRKRKKKADANALPPQSEGIASQPIPSHPNSKEEDKYKDRGVPRKRGLAKVPVPESFPITTEMHLFATKCGVLDAQTETDAMLDHFRGKGECRSDWLATWRNWIRRSKSFHRNGGVQRESKTEFNRREAEKLRARFDLEDSSGNFGDLN